MLTYLCIGLCAVGLAVMVYRYDLYEKEPLHMIVIAMAIGWGAMAVVGWIEDGIIRWQGFSSVTLLAISASVLEESVKVAAVVVIAVTFRRHFNDPMDGMIYGAMVGLGAALCETRVYLEYSNPGLPVAGREAIRLVLHLLLGAIDGFAVGMARFRIGRWREALALFLTGSMTVHFLWDRFCGLASAEFSPMFQRGVAILLMLVTMAWFGGLLVIASHHSRKHHDPGSLRRLWNRRK